MRISQLWTVALIAGSMLFCPAAGASSVLASCNPIEEKDGESIVCQLRSTGGESLSEIKAVDDDGRQLEVAAEPYSWTRNRTAIYFLVQTSDLSADQLRRVASFLERAASPVGERMIGLGTVDFGFKERAALGAYRLQVDREVQAIGSANTSRAYPEITDHMRAVLEKLAAAKAERRALVIVGDGASNANSATERELADLARRNEVAVYNFVLSKSDRPQSSVLNRIAERSDGASRDVSTGSNSDVLKLASDLFALVENGSVLRINAKGLPKETEITLKATAGDRQVTATPVAVTRLTEDSFKDRAFDFVGRNMFALLAGLGLMSGFAMILGSVVLPRWRQGREAGDVSMGYAATEPDSVPGPLTDANAPTEIVMKSGSGSSGAQPLGWLELIGADSARMPLYAGSVRLGRHRENDVCLMNNSVHRRHAILHVSENGDFSIQDLATKNGVAVNGARVSQQSLADGDVIELGEVRLRFIANQDALRMRSTA